LVARSWVDIWITLLVHPIYLFLSTAGSNNSSQFSQFATSGP